MVTDGGYTSGENNIMSREVESLCCVPDTNITLCINYTKKTYLIKGDAAKPVRRGKFMFLKAQCRKESLKL